MSCLETIPLGKWGVGANRMKEICALHKSEFMRQIDERRLLIIFYVQVPFWAKDEMIPIKGKIFPFSRELIRHSNIKIDTEN